jgi:nucleoside-diphosphate-sugar epimerase
MREIRILITGKNSYIGSSLKKYLHHLDGYNVNEVDVRKIDWEYFDFTEYDVILHLAAIVHQKKNSISEQMYFDVNYKLPVKIAKKAKEGNVNQFIFMSTMAVYGMNGDTKKEIRIDKQTKCNPRSYYAKSKFMAENHLSDLNNDKFKVAILRPPMVYGEGCKGNYQALKRLAKIPIVVFPKIDNKRSVISIENLVLFLKNVIDNQAEGIFLPQDGDFSSTKDLMLKLVKDEGNKIIITRLLNPVVNLLSVFKSDTINKVFGSLIYDKSTYHNFSPINVLENKNIIDLEVE